MQNNKKWVPPPPSKPPPENIGRSGRVPLPKGGPISTGGAGVDNPYRRNLRDAKRDIGNGAALSKDTSRCADRGRDNRPYDEESASKKESGRGGSFGSSDSPERNANLVAAARRRRSSPQPRDSSSGGDFAATSVPGTPSPGDTDESGWRRKGEEEQSSRLDFTDDQESRESTARWSSDYDQETTKDSGRPVDDPSEEGNEGRRQRESPRRRRKSGDRFHRSRNRWRSESTSDSDLGGEGRLRVARDDTNGTKQRSRREDTSRKASQQDPYPEDAGGSRDQESPLSCSDVEDRELSDPPLPSEDAGSRSSTCRRGSDEGHQLHRGEMTSRKYARRGSAAEDASETAEVHGLGRNGDSSQSAGLESGAGGRKLERCSSYALAQKRRDFDDVDADEPPPTCYPDADPHRTSDMDAGSAPESRNSSTGSSEGYAEVSREHGRAQPVAGREDGGTTGETRHSAAINAGGVVGGAEGGGISSSPSPGKDVSSRTENITGNPPPAGAATAGKPIRGARWGEAIGVRSKVFDTTTIPTGRADVRDFVCSPLRSGPGTVLRCFVERNRNGVHRFSKVYSIYADLEDGSGRLLLTARKLLASKTAYYIICCRHDDLFQDDGKRGGRSFLGKLRATSAAHKEYALYDSGDNPSSAVATETKDFFPEDGFSSARETESKSRQNSSEDASATPLERGGEGRGELRRELAMIVYHFNKKEERTGKRRMEVAIPQIRQQGDAWEQVLWQPSDTKQSINLNFDRIRHQGAQNLLEEERLLVFHQRESRYDPLSSCLVDFRGRATAPSVKNFQLIKSAPEDTIKRTYYYNEGAGKKEKESDDYPKPVYLQMGKVGKDCFNVDVEWPLSLLQAFAICLSRFDTKAHF